MSLPVAEYRPHHPQESDYYHCVEDYLEAFVRDYDEHFSRKYEFWRPYIEKVIYRYLDCCDLSHGFARVKCKDCGDEYLLAFSCKRRHFCPSCHQKRVVDQKIYEVALGLPEMQGCHADHQLHRRSGSHRGNSHPSGLWLIRSRPPPKIHDPPNIEYAPADLQVQPHPDIIGACPRPDREATSNIPGMILFSHDFLTHLKICVMERPA